MHSDGRPNDDPDEQGSFSLYIEVFDDEAAAEDHFDAFYDVNKGMSEPPT